MCCSPPQPPGTSFRKPTTKREELENGGRGHISRQWRIEIALLNGHNHFIVPPLPRSISLKRFTPLDVLAEKPGWPGAGRELEEAIRWAAWLLRQPQQQPVARPRFSATGCERSRC